MMNQAEAQGRVNVAQPPNYLVRATVLSLVLVPLGLLIAASKLVETLGILSGPPYRSEISAWMSALMAMMAGFAALLGIFTPVAAFVKALQVNSKFNAGDYVGAEKASKRAAYYSKQSIIFLFILLVLIFTDIFRYLTTPITLH
jgi:uncharacterized membrane protein